jgi:hypothetical protein
VRHYTSWVERFDAYTEQRITRVHPHLAHQYAAETLDLTSCTHDLGLIDPKAVADLIRRHENLQQEFGLVPLLKRERIRREWWESDRNFFSPYQELARLLKLGKPVRIQ